MEKKDLRIVFMGTPEFAVESLKAIVENDFNIVGVITTPDRPAGRGYKLQESAVKKYAVEQGLKVLQPNKLRDEGFLAELSALEADIQVVVAFRMLPEVVWQMPRLGTFNLHGSLLPQYRGAAPINWAVINGEEKTGVTTFFLKHEIDTGEIIYKAETPIGPDDTAGIIHDRLMDIGADLVIKTLDAVVDESIESKPQSEFYNKEEELKPAPKIFRETGEINWEDTTQHIHNLIRGLSPYPAAWTAFEIEGKMVNFKIYASQMVDESHELTPGTIVTDNKATLRVATQDGFIEILELQMAGKRRMKTRDLLNGFSFPQ